MTDEERADEMKKERDLHSAIGKILLPLVSPYDLSDKSLMNHYYNNPYFQCAVKHLVNMLINERK